MVTLKVAGGQTEAKRSLQMELMIVAIGLVSMMVVSLAFQRASYKKVTVNA